MSSVSPPTLRDVAKQANVSKSTAGAALNSDKGVHPETQARVLEAARTLGYRHNPQAANLRARRGSEIAVYFHESPDDTRRNELNEKLVTPLAIELGRRGHQVQLITQNSTESSLSSFAGLVAVVDPSTDRPLPNVPFGVPVWAFGEVGAQAQGAEFVGYDFQTIVDQTVASLMSRVDSIQGERRFTVLSAVDSEPPYLGVFLKALREKARADIGFLVTHQRISTDSVTQAKTNIALGEQGTAGVIFWGIIPDQAVAQLLATAVRAGKDIPPPFFFVDGPVQGEMTSCIALPHISFDLAKAGRTVAGHVADAMATRAPATPIHLDYTFFPGVGEFPVVGQTLEDTLGIQTPLSRRPNASA